MDWLMVNHPVIAGMLTVLLVAVLTMGFILVGAIIDEWANEHFDEWVYGRRRK